MKKLLSAILTLTMLFTAFTAVNSAGEDVKVILDGQEITFDVPPQIIEGRTLVPFRAIFEALGYTVDWMEETQTVISLRAGKFISMQIGSNFAYMTSTDETGAEVYSAENVEL